jgi:beta-glucosidase-like glycosyl hydrolase
MLGAAEVSGIVSSSPIVVLKHFGPYGQETDRRTVTNTIGQEALYNNYLRPFYAALQAATDPSVPATRRTVMMCSYGNLGSQRACISPILNQALRDFNYTGVVRSDLDVKTNNALLLQHGVSMIKPFDATKLTLTDATLTALNRAAYEILRLTFGAGLVQANTIIDPNAVGSLSPATANRGRALSNEIERRGAVLLKNDTSVGTGLR